MADVAARSPAQHLGQHTPTPSQRELKQKAQSDLESRLNGTQEGDEDYEEEEEQHTTGTGEIAEEEEEEEEEDDDEGTETIPAGNVEADGSVVDRSGNIIGHVPGENASQLSGSVVDQEGDVLDDEGNVIGHVDLEEVANEAAKELAEAEPKPIDDGAEGVEKPAASVTSGLDKPEVPETEGLEKPEVPETEGLEKPEVPETEGLEKPDVEGVEKPELAAPFGVQDNGDLTNATGAVIGKLQKGTPQDLVGTSIKEIDEEGNLRAESGSVIGKAELHKPELLEKAGEEGEEALGGAKPDLEAEIPKSEISEAGQKLDKDGLSIPELKVPEGAKLDDEGKPLLGEKGQFINEDGKTILGSDGEALKPTDLPEAELPETKIPEGAKLDDEGKPVLGEKGQFIGEDDKTLLGSDGEALKPTELPEAELPETQIPEGAKLDEEGKPVLGADGQFLTEDGKTILGEDGEPLKQTIPEAELPETQIPEGAKLDEEGKPVLGADGQFLNEDGKTILGEDGEPLKQTLPEAELPEVKIPEGAQLDEEGKPILGDDGQFLGEDGKTILGEDGERLKAVQEPELPETKIPEGAQLDEEGQPILGADGQFLGEDGKTILGEDGERLKAIKPELEIPEGAKLDEAGKPVLGKYGQFVNEDGKTILGEDGEPLMPADLGEDGLPIPRLELPKGAKLDEEGKPILGKFGQFLNEDGKTMLGTDGEPIKLPEGIKLDEDGKPILDDEGKFIPAVQIPKGAKLDEDGNPVLGADGQFLNEDGKTIFGSDGQPIIDEAAAQLPDLSILKGKVVNKIGKIVDENGTPFGQLVEGYDPKKLIGRKVDADGNIWNDSGKIIGKAELLPEDEREAIVSAPFEDFPDSIVDAKGNVIFEGKVVGKLVEGDPKKLEGKKVDADGDVVDKNGNVLGKAERWQEEEVEPEEEEKIDLSILEGMKVNKAGNVVDDNGKPYGRIITGVIAKLVGKKCDKDGKIWGEAGNVIGTAELIPAEDRDQDTGGPFEDFPGAVVDSKGFVIFEGVKVGKLIEGDAKKLAGKKIDADGEILDKVGNVLGRAERWEEEEVPEVVVDNSALAGKRVNKIGNVVDSHGSIFGRLIQGDPKRLAGRMCDKDGNVRSEGGDIIGKAELIPESEREGEKEGPFAGFDNPTVTKDGKVQDSKGVIIGRLIEGDAKKLYGKSVDADGDVLDRNGNALGKAERWEEEEKEVAKNPLAGRKVNREGNVVDENGDLIGKLTDGDVLKCSGKEIDNDGDVYNHKGQVVGHVSLLEDIPEPEPEPEPEVQEDPEEVEKRKQLEQDKQLARRMAGAVGQCLDKIKPILKMITDTIDAAERQPKEELDEQKLVDTVKPLIEQGGQILQEANGVIRGLDPDGRIAANAKAKTASREATPEEYALADVLKDLTENVTTTIEQAKKKIAGMPHAKKELNPLWALLAEPLGQILAAVGLLLAGVLGLVGRLLSGLGLGGLLDNLLGGLGLKGILKGLGLGFVTESLTGRK